MKRVELITPDPWQGKLPGTVFEMDDKAAAGYAGSGVVRILEAGPEVAAGDYPKDVHPADLPESKAAVMDEPAPAGKGKKDKKAKGKK